MPIAGRAVGRGRGRPRDVAALTYAANPYKKGLDRVLAAWRRARGATGEELFVAGLCAGADGAACATRARWPADEYRALLRRARVYVTAPRREDYGIAQLEALADGCRVVTTPAPGPYAALPIARALDPRLVADASRRRAARARWTTRARLRRSGPWPRSRRYRRAAVDRVVARAAAAALLLTAARRPRRGSARALLRAARCAARGQGRVLATSRAVSQARRAVATPQRMCLQRVDAVGVGVDDDRHARRARPRARGRR